MVRALLDRFPAVEIRCLVRDPARASGLRDARVEIAVGDLRDLNSLRAAFDGADTLVNVASLGFDWNDTLFSAIRGSGLARGVFISTTAILTKLPVRSRALRQHGESLVRDSGLLWTILRPTMIYGTPADRNIARLIRFVERSPIVPVVAGDARQQPVHVGDVAAAVASAVAERETIAGTYNISGGAPLTLEEMVRTIVKLLGRKRLIVRIPSAPVRAAVGFMGRIARQPALSVEQIDRLHEDKAFDHADATRVFGYAPRSFEEGVRAQLELMMRAL
ncbi:MAG: NAD(P)H-binding protein [Acidobacteriota bacterium]|nr:NAD(P)H-binding protein [Acidobacteriota bacterium]